MFTIIGGGIAGLTTAATFEKLNIEYHLFERSAEFRDVGAGIWLAPNAMQVIKWLGLDDRMLEEGNELTQFGLASDNLHFISKPNLDIVKNKFGYSTVAIHRARLQKVLLESIPKNKISLGHSFKNFQVHGETCLSSFENGFQHSSKFLIGADGINSKLRQQIFPKAKIRFANQICWRGISTLDIPDEFKHAGYELWGHGIRFGFSPISDNEVYWFAVDTGKKLLGSESCDKQMLLEKYKNFHPFVKQIIQQTAQDRIILKDIEDLEIIPKWYNENVLLIGDAAHATTPNMGQGGCQGIEDAYYLGQFLVQEKDPPEAFKMFQKFRKNKVHQIVNGSYRLGKIAHWKYGKTIRNSLMSVVPSSILQKQLQSIYSLPSI